MEANAKFYRLVKESLVLIAFANKESLKRRNVDEDSGQILLASSRKFGTNRICEQRIPKKMRDVDVGSG